MSHRYLILGLLAEQPMTGYDIRKHVQDMLRAVTNASYGTLYPTLHKLLADGAVQMQEIEQEGRPAKKVYRITEVGHSELGGWLKEPPAADNIKREFLLKLYFAKNLPQAELQRLLTERRDATQARLDHLCAERDALQDSRQRWIVDYSVSLCRAEMDWLTQLEQQIDFA
jgi:PadR family transcriptional regulator, regulatory protein AphA